MSSSGATLGGQRERRAGVRLDALDHGAETIRALRGQMLAQSQFFEQPDRIGIQDLARRFGRIKREQNRDQSAYDVRVAVADKGEQWAGGAITADFGAEPDLAGAALNLVRFRAQLLGQRRQRP